MLEDNGWMVFYQWGLLCLFYRAMESIIKKFLSNLWLLSIISPNPLSKFLTPCVNFGVGRAKVNTCSMILELVLPCSQIYGFYPLEIFFLFFSDIIYFVRNKIRKKSGKKHGKPKKQSCKQETFNNKSRKEKLNRKNMEKKPNHHENWASTLMVLRLHSS